mmetsp:Transcript_18603/g.22855  ORF Transcript_18603/g.22855 Transcript_18603/m.22855 type:complete len:138 (+) Transcript_18603:916-1329(+)
MKPFEFERKISFTSLSICCGLEVIACEAIVLIPRNIQVNITVHSSKLSDELEFKSKSSNKNLVFSSQEPPQSKLKLENIVNMLPFRSVFAKSRTESLSQNGLKCLVAIFKLRLEKTCMKISNVKPTDPGSTKFLKSE